MQNEEEQVIDLENDEETTVEETATETTTEDDTVDYKAEAAKWKAIALRKKDKKPSDKLQTPEQKPDYANDIEFLKLAEKKRQVGYKHGLSPEETDRLFRFAGKEDPDEVFKDPFFQAGLKEFRAQKAVEGAIPSSTNHSRKIDGKTFAEMTPEERKKNWSKITGK